MAPCFLPFFFEDFFAVLTSVAVEDMASGEAVVALDGEDMAGEAAEFVAGASGEVAGALPAAMATVATRESAETDSVRRSFMALPFG